MAAATGPRKTVSIHNYPEHLNPFHEDDNHNKIRFWTIGRKLNRSNSINFSGIKDLKNSWAFRSFMRKGKKGHQVTPDKKENEITSNGTNNGEPSPIVFRRALQYTSSSNAGSRSTIASPERYVYGGSVTPLPRSRFQERLRSPSQHEVNSLSATPRMARSEVSGSRLSVESTNPFDEAPIPPVRASRRKKKRAPPPPPGADTSIPSTTELQIVEVEENKVTKVDDELDVGSDFKVELKIIEDEDRDRQSEKHSEEKDIEIVKVAPIATIASCNINHNEDKKNDAVDKIVTNEENTSNDKVATDEKSRTVTVEANNNNKKEEGSVLDTVSFEKVDIKKYRRNSSLNEDDIVLRRGNLEDINNMSNKRSKSMSNALDRTYISFDINLNEPKFDDVNGNSEPQKVVCKLYEDSSRKQSIDNSISSTEKEFIEIDRATRELEREISKLNSALIEDDDVITPNSRLSVSELKRKFCNNNVTSPNPIPKPRRSHYSDSSSPVNGT